MIYRLFKLLPKAWLNYSAMSGNNKIVIAISFVAKMAAWVWVYYQLINRLEVF